MPKLLHIQSSPNLENSVTRTLSSEFVDGWVARHDHISVEWLDLARDPLPHWGADAINGFVKPEDQWSPGERQAVELSERLIQQLESTDMLVIGCPMYNMSMPTQLKSWIDYISRPQRSFKFIDRTHSEGLIADKKTFVILSRGGDYSRPPASSSDFQEPMLRAALALVGIRAVTFIRAEGQRMQEAPSYIETAREDIAALID